MAVLAVSPISAQTTWRQVTSGTTSRLRAVAFVNGLFIACGENSGTEKEPLYGLVSPDGEHWKKTQLANLKDLVRVGNRAAGTPHPNGGGLYLTRDGSSAAQIGRVSLGTGLPAYTIKAIADGANLWLASSSSGIFRFNDPVHLEAASDPNTNVNGDITGIAYGNGVYLAKRANGEIAYSSDGANWQTRVGVTVSAPRLIFGNGLFLAYDGLIYSKSSNNGTSWSPVVHGAGFINSMIFADGLFAIASSGGVALSPDGETWVEGFNSANAEIRGIAYGEAGISTVPPTGRWVAVGDNGKIYVSDKPASVGSSPITINGAVQLRWLGETGKSYQVQSSTNLGEWEDLGGVIVGTGVEIVISQPIVPPSRFYRVIPQVP